MALVRLEPSAIRSGAKQSTAEPLHSLFKISFVKQEGNGGNGPKGTFIKRSRIV